MAARHHRQRYRHGLRLMASGGKNRPANIMAKTDAIFCGLWLCAYFYRPIDAGGTLVATIIFSARWSILAAVVTRLMRDILAESIYPPADGRNGAVINAAIVFYQSTRISYNRPPENKTAHRRHR